MNGYKIPMNGFCQCVYCGELVATGALNLSKHRRKCNPNSFVYTTDTIELTGHWDKLIQSELKKENN